MIRYVLTVAIALITIAAWSQENVTLNGYVKDEQNGEELIGVTVYIPSLKVGASTNAYGFYSITIPKGQYAVSYSFVGFKTQTVTISLNTNQAKNIELESESIVMEEFVVSDKAIDENVIGLQMSKNTINMAQIKKLPALFGEVDILKTVQMMPGVIYAGEGTSAFYVRGGSADQNSILIDEAPIYDPSHLFGLFSVFNADVIKESELYRGGIPARFGGRLSSMLEVRTKDGNTKNYNVTGGIGTLASRLAVEGPIVKEKSSFIVSARRSYAEPFLKAANQNNTVFFYDVNAKVSWKFSNKDRVFAAFYAGRDKFSFGNDFGFDWGNKTGTLRWNHLFNDRLFSNTTFIVNSFDYKLESKDPVQGFSWTSNLQEISFKNDLSYFINTNNDLSFGYHITGRKFSPGRIRPTTDISFFDNVELEKMHALDHALYISNQQRLNDKITFDYGVRLSIFQNLGKTDVYVYSDSKDQNKPERIDTLQFKAWQNIKTYVNLEPRLSMRYIVGSGQSVKLSYNRMVQNTHLISAGTVPVPFNTWNPSGYYLRPQLADQIAVGYFRNSRNNSYEFSAEAYYKYMQHVTDFADNAEIFFNENLSTTFRQGTAVSYGLELMVTKTQGKFTGMMNYTLSKAERTIEDVNQGNTFAANYDRRNVLNIQAAYELSKRWTFGGTFTYSTGRPITLPTGKYEFQNYHPDIISERNGYRLPDFHRLDLSATLTPKKNENRKWQGSWVFSIYNAYNRKNPFTIYTRTAKDKDGNIIGDGTKKEARMIYLFPIFPSVTYNFKF
jgi:hypothetical protein